MSIKTVYLAGPIQHVSSTEASGWRDELAQLLRERGITCLDPTRNQDQKRHEDGTWDKEAIVELDIADLHQSDVLIAYTPKPSSGTSMEVLYMKHVLQKTVYVVYENEDLLSPWIEYYADKCFRTFSDLLDFLKGAW